MNQKLVSVSVLAAVLVGGLLGSSQAEQSSDFIYACKTPKVGVLIRASTTPVTCPAGTSAIQWGSGNVGPKGDKGEPGETGAQGMQGPKGDKGDPGYSYEEVLAQVGGQESNVNVYFFGGNMCVGTGVTQVMSSSSWCLKELSGSRELQVLSVVGSRGSTINGMDNAFQPYWLLPQDCPTNATEVSRATGNFSRNPDGVLMSEEKPFKLNIETPSSCLAIYTRADQFANGVLQVIMKQK